MSPPLLLPCPASEPPSLSHAPVPARASRPSSAASPRRVVPPRRTTLCRLFDSQIPPWVGRRLLGRRLLPPVHQMTSYLWPASLYTSAAREIRMCLSSAGACGGVSNGRPMLAWWRRYESHGFILGLPESCKLRVAARGQLGVIRIPQSRHQPAKAFRKNIPQIRHGSATVRRVVG